MAELESWLSEKIGRWLRANPDYTQEEMELFYIQEVLPYDKRDIAEITNTHRSWHSKDE